ncbi:DUF7341 domain-containing protein [Nesterenkonia haasae]
MTLSDNVHRLTRHHLTLSTKKVTTVPPLLDQLAEAVHSNTRTRSGGRNERGLPINSDAIDLWKELDTQVRTAEANRTGTTRGHLTQILQRWKNLTDPHLTQITTNMVTQIENLLDPPPPRRPIRQPCPACDQEWTHDTAGDRKPALTANVYDPEGGVLPPTEWDIHCAECQAQWHPNDPAFKILIQLLTTTQEAVIR